MNYLEKYHFWLENEYFDQKAKEELRALDGDEEEIKDRFYKDLEFGTGGLRGKIGMGTNRMNIYTVSKATQGLADYLIENAQFNEAKNKLLDDLENSGELDLNLGLDNQQSINLEGK